jgi:hypothetical protein
MPGPLVAVSLGPVVRSVRVLIASLSVLAITVHGELDLSLKLA